jgi:hypothetical protein
LQTAVAPNSWAVICLWRRFFQLRDEESEQSAEILAAALEQVVDDRDDCPIACDEVAQARRDCIRDYYRQILSGSSAAANPRLLATTTAASSGAAATTDPRIVLASLVEQAQSAQEARVSRNQPNLTIPVSNGNGRVVEHLQLAQ